MSKVQGYSQTRAHAPLQAKTTPDRIYNVPSLNERISKCVISNFSKEVTCDGIIDQMDGNCAILKDAENKIECFSDYSINDFSNGDNVRIKGTVIVRSNKIIMNMKCIDKNTEGDKQNREEKNKLQKKYEIYDNKLQTPSFIKKIGSIKMRHATDNIQKIGLLITPGDDRVEFFIKEFQEKCTGKLFVYKLNPALSNVISAIEYFNKYYELDMICVLSNNISLDDVYNLSTSALINFLSATNNKSTIPYLVSVINKNCQETLFSRLSNKTFYSGPEFINHVRDKQIQFINCINSAIDNVECELKCKLAKFDARILDARLKVVRMIDMRFFNDHNNPETLIKRLLNSSLDNELTKVKNIFSESMRHILDDYRIETICKKVIESEKKFLIDYENEIKATQYRLGNDAALGALANAPANAAVAPVTVPKVNNGTKERLYYDDDMVIYDDIIYDDIVPLDKFD